MIGWGLQGGPTEDPVQGLMTPTSNRQASMGYNIALVVRRVASLWGALYRTVTQAFISERNLARRSKIENGGSEHPVTTLIRCQYFRVNTQLRYLRAQLIHGRGLIPWISRSILNTRLFRNLRRVGRFADRCLVVERALNQGVVVVDIGSQDVMRVERRRQFLERAARRPGALHRNQDRHRRVE